MNRGNRKKPEAAKLAALRDRLAHALLDEEARLELEDAIKKMEAKS